MFYRGKWNANIIKRFKLVCMTGFYWVRKYILWLKVENSAKQICNFVKRQTKLEFSTQHVVMWAQLLICNVHALLDKNLINRVRIYIKSC